MNCKAMEKKELTIKNEFDKNSFINFFTALDLTIPKKIIIEDQKNSRTAAQNRLLWLWNNEIQQFMFDHSGITASAFDWHETMVERLCPTVNKEITLPNGETVSIQERTRTSKFNTKKMTEYLEMLDAYCASFGLLLPHPQDLMNAIYGKRNI
ncbi:recombination protein NinB [Entomomonas asaccharolytica]|uniref:Recombination protein NinB n=1 Tax=Entomomonas asaccharolytica TaxID=2785331 RepID=A0A974NEQ3_9GAMM|nr:recombination protein NinB [Entomomonas asaccharolytica]QQP85037.1 recombination protein NinB [Entomomonas asaccharolytica]